MLWSKGDNHPGGRILTALPLHRDPLRLQDLEGLGYPSQDVRLLAEDAVAALSRVDPQTILFKGPIQVGDLRGNGAEEESVLAVPRSSGRIRR